MSWPVVAQVYLDSFEKARAQEPRADHSQPSGAIPPHDLPELNLEHLLRLTDHTGLLQHATFATPRYSEGYCLDDNARALLLTALLEGSGRSEEHTSELQSQSNLVCRLLLEKKKK